MVLDNEIGEKETRIMKHYLSLLLRVLFMDQRQFFCLWWKLVSVIMSLSWIESKLQVTLITLICPWSQAWGRIQWIGKYHQIIKGDINFHSIPEQIQSLVLEKSSSWESEKLDRGCWMAGNGACWVVHHQTALSDENKQSWRHNRCDLWWYFVRPHSNDPRSQGHTSNEWDYCPISSSCEKKESENKD